MKTWVLVAFALTTFSISISIVQRSDTSEAAERTSTTAKRESLKHWEKVFEVFSHPRCTNCHVPADNRPRWSGPSYGLKEGEWRYHGINVIGGITRDGRDTIHCSACHASINSDLPHGPPGAPRWSLAPAGAAFLDKSSQEICEQIRDPSRNGGLTLNEIAHNIGHDPLVIWAWSPGPDREPAPYSVDETVANIIKWMEAGAHCPNSE